MKPEVVELSPLLPDAYHKICACFSHLFRSVIKTSMDTSVWWKEEYNSPKNGEHIFGEYNVDSVQKSKTKFSHLHESRGGSGRLSWS